ncbi:MAG: hypothetical protein LBS62_03555 [Clostridiales bacterium]|jgi:glutaredoxin-related protein|nr:hypothetical protein [Clostridiales bacterium]
MNNIELFSHKDCPNCPAAKEALTQKGIPFTYIDISESMANLKLFFKYRDFRPEFDEVKRNGRIGVPCVVVNDGEKIFFGAKDEDINGLG